MFGRDEGFGVPAAAVAMEGAEGKEKRAELFVGERRSAEEEERTEKREGGSADMMVCENPRGIGESRVIQYHVSSSSSAKILVYRRGQSTASFPSMNSPASSPVPRPSEFQTHIYNSFLQGRTTDVTLRIHASWNAIYNCHRVVLIQAVCTLFRSFR